MLVPRVFGFLFLSLGVAMAKSTAPTIQDLQVEAKNADYRYVRSLYAVNGTN